MSASSIPPARVPSSLTSKFPISPEEFFAIIERKDGEKLQALGGIDDVVEKLHTHKTTGLPPDDSGAERVLRYGENRLPESEKVTFLGLVREALKDKIMILLIICAVISIVFGMTMKDPHTGEVEENGWIEGTAILTSVAVVVLLSSLSDYQKAKKFEELSKEQEGCELQVVRHGARMTIDASELVVGDLLKVEGGQTMRADALIVGAQDLKMDESSVTGESDLVKKRPDGDCYILSGSEVNEGQGEGIVIAVGVHSFSGHLQMQTRKGPSETPLQVKLGVMANRIGYLGTAGAVLTWLVLSGMNLYRTLNDDQKELNIAEFLSYIIVAITIVVVAIPEGLPLAVTIALAYAMKAMTKDRCLVRVLKSCETMGGCTAICSDKTGTLTTNSMTVVQGWLADESFVLPNFGVEGPPGATNPVARGGENFALQSASVDVLDDLCRSISINSTAEQVRDGENLVWKGNKTEQGLLTLVSFRGGYDHHRKALDQENFHCYPFSSKKKRMTTLVRGQKGGMVAHVKGASELILEDCEYYVTADGTPTELIEDKREEIKGLLRQMADQGNRVIGIAYADLGEEAEFPEEEPNPPLTLMGVLGMQDPIRAEVPKAVQDCVRAGITVRMVTGDNLHTAKAIAKKCGILSNEDEEVAIEGRDFRAMAQEEPERFQQMLPKLRVVARSSPDDKHILVGSLMDGGDIVGVTGDGTNDAPALTLADVGFAMKSGTEVARGASDMILVDDNFATVVRAALWGRTVNDNIRKFIQFQLTTNLVGVMLTLIGSAMSSAGESPLTPVQLLWLNLIMDTMAAMALATERPTEACLDRAPIWRNAPLISKAMWTFIVGHGLFQLTTMLLLIYNGHVWFNVGPCGAAHPNGKVEQGNCQMGATHRTMVFNTFILFQAVNEFNARRLYAGEVNPFEGIKRSRILLIVFVITVLFQVFAVEVAGTFMDTKPLSPKHWGICLGIAALELPVGIVVKLIAGGFKEWEPSTVLEKVDIEKADALVQMNGPNSRLRDYVHQIQSQQRVIQALAEKPTRTKSDPGLRTWSLRSVQRNESTRGGAMSE